METFCALLAICAGNSPATGEFPAQRPVTRSFDYFFDLRLNKRLSKQAWGWWLATPSGPLWRHCNGMSFLTHSIISMFIIGTSGAKNLFCFIFLISFLPVQWEGVFILSTVLNNNFARNQYSWVAWNLVLSHCYMMTWWHGRSHFMMTSSNGNIFRVAGPLCGEFTGHRVWLKKINHWFR